MYRWTAKDCSWRRRKCSFALASFYSKANFPRWLPPSIRQTGSREDFGMNLFGVMSISASALQAERVRAEVVAANMANTETTRTARGGPYQRQHVVFQQAGNDGFAASLLGSGAGF